MTAMPYDPTSSRSSTSTTRSCRTTRTSSGRSSCIEQGKLDRVEYDSANRDLVARYNRGEAGAIEFTEFYLSTLTRFDADELAVLHERSCANASCRRFRRRARDLIAKHQRLGHLLVLSTATSRFLTEPVARELGFVHHIATEPEVKEGRFTGRVLGTPNMREGKVERLLEWLAALEPQAVRLPRELVLQRLAERPAAPVARHASRWP